jgi:hypothetical protein
LSRKLGLAGLSADRRPRITAEQVKRYLRRQVELAEADAQAIRRSLESISLILDEPDVARRFRGFPSYAEVLPKILFLYLIGREPRAIAGELNFLATDYGIEMVVDITAQVVAERLNAV